MERRENALREALTDNSEETQRWKSYKNENETAIENLGRFSEHLSVDVMVPLGRKGYMPGQLIHTNEVLVGHYQGYFSKCSAFKAKEICRRRLHMASEHLKKLETEAVLWQNKLEMPYTMGVLPEPESREIIEDYDEEKEKLWREEHKVRLRQSRARNKLENQLNTEDDEKTDLSANEIFKKLEEAELMEELEQELEKLAVDEVNDETIRKLMSGEMKLPSGKQRVAHNTMGEVELKTDGLIENESLHRIVKKAELRANSITVPATNNNNRPNPELQVNAPVEAVDVNDLEVEEDLPREVQTIKEEANFLSFIDQIGFYECQIKIVRQKLLALPLKSQDDVDQKVNLLNVLENLEELMEIAEDNAAADEENVTKFNSEEDLLGEEHILPKMESGSKASKKQNRRISFALENDTLEFRKNETVSEMLPKVKRDIITFDEPVKNTQTAMTKTEDDRKKAILDKVEQSLQYTAEYQSEQDFDLVNKILDFTSGKCNTLHIGFEHSTQRGVDILDLQSNNVPGSPADLYNMHLKNLQIVNTKESETLFVNAYEGEDEVRVPTLKEAEREQAYVDPRLEFSKPIPEESVTESTEPVFVESTTKSILRNKAAKIETENERNVVGKKKSKKKTSESVLNEETYMSAYYKVMKEVVEKPITEPEPLPDGKYIDAHAPKKRVSRFKQARSKTEQI